MSLLIQTLEQQLNLSLYGPEQSPQNKERIAVICERTKVIAAVLAVSTPVFAFFFPVMFTTVFSLTTAFLAYELFNIADNLGDAARHSAQDIQPRACSSRVEMMLESTFLSKLIYQRMKP